MKLLLQHLCLCVAAFSQTFEAASVKPSTRESTRATFKSDPGQIAYTNATLTAIILRAYDVQPYQVSGPDWLGTARYDIAAKLPPDTAKPQLQQMLQQLLAERFHLALHHETRQLQGFELVPGRGAPKLTPSSTTGDAAEPDAPPKIDAAGYPVLERPALALMEGVRGKAVLTFLTAKAQPLSALTALLSREFRLPVLDKTGLNGTFDFRLEFAPQAPGAVPAPLSPDTLPAAADDSGANLISAVPQQLGLRLAPARIPVDILVIDRTDRIPTGN